MFRTNVLSSGPNTYKSLHRGLPTTTTVPRLSTMHGLNETPYIIKPLKSSHLSVKRGPGESFHQKLIRQLIPEAQQGKISIYSTPKQGCDSWKRGLGSFVQ